MFLDLRAGARRDRLADAGVEQAKVFIDLRGGAHGGAWVAGIHPLLDRDGWWQTFDIVAFRLAHASQELTGIGGKTFHIASLSFGIERVECQGGLAAT